MKPSGSADSFENVVERPAQCPQCGATTRLGEGPCVNCLLHDALETEGEASSDVFESVLAEADVPDHHWRLGNYEILGEIGRGGMGVIYRARQRHSRRIVAVKRVLTYHSDSHETLVRFRREAEAAASLDHPNILPIYEVSESEDGLPFFSMKLATGGSLRSAGPALRADPRECVKLIAKVARAIEHAHAQGIFHRDLQPGNILLDARGEPLVSDFGLAKWLGDNTDLTRTLTTFGTPGYIAPEQAEGTTSDLTPAPDVYSLGAILFNLLANRPPFVGANALSVIRQAAMIPAPKLRSLAPSLPRDLETITARCLESDPKARYASAGALAEDLERWVDGRPILARRVLPPTRIWRWSRRNPILAVAATICLVLTAAVVWLLRDQSGVPLRVSAPEKSIAVLPFDNLSGDPDNTYFADGIKDEILTRLSKIAALKVIARGSTQKFKGATDDVREIAQQLGVANILTGSVRKSGETVRITVHLINAPSNTQLWAETYGRKLTDMFQVESDVAQHIAAALETTLTGSEQRALKARPTASVEAHHAYLKGRYYWNQRTSEGYKQAAEHFNRAIEVDPTYAQAYAGLADAIQFLASDLLEPKEALTKSRAALQKAIELDETQAEPHASLGLLAMNLGWDWAEAEREFIRAIELDSNYATAHHWYGEFLAYMGRFEEAIAEIKRAHALDPLSLIISTDVAKVYMLARRYDDAIEQYKKVLEMDPEFELAGGLLAQTYSLKGLHKEALEEFRKIKVLDNHPTYLSLQGYVCGMAGRKDEAQRAVNRLRDLSNRTYVSPFLMAIAYTGLGEKDQVFELFERVFEERATGGAVVLKVNPVFDSLRSDPRFDDLLRRANFP